MSESKTAIRIALAANANTGKSTFFNQVTGASQHVGNWPGKTVEKVEGFVKFGPYDVYILDLPGTYSLSAYSEEEMVAREYIAIHKPDVVLNIIDASAIERNLYLTVQLLELETPLVVALNMVDIAAKKGFKINIERFSEILGVPVIPMVAVSGRGVGEALSVAVEVALGRIKISPIKVVYGLEVEKALAKLTNELQEKLPSLCKMYPARWLAIKILEEDEDILRKVASEPRGSEVIKTSEKVIGELEAIHGEPIQVIIASERYAFINRIVKEVLTVEKEPLITFGERLDLLTTHMVWGYFLLAVIMSSVFASVFIVGGLLSTLLEHYFSILVIPLLPEGSGFIRGLVDGLIAGVILVIPYVIPFYFILFFLENSGYLPRAAFLLDALMHKIGLHGKAFIPLLLGYGCNVPACLGCRIMETGREKLILGLMITMIPCAARTIVILTLVGEYLGVHVALAIYALDLIVVFIIGKMASAVLPGSPIGLIMEMPPYRIPSLKVIAVETYVRVKDFIVMAFPLLIVGSGVVGLLNDLNLLKELSNILSPGLNLLGLPSVTGIPLIFGILRKELTIAMLAEVAGTTDFNAVLTHRQMVVFSVFTILYIPCIATIVAMFKEYGFAKTILITLTNIAVAITVSALANIVLTSIGVV
ncbi:MAG: ferrous iron transport protein B [Candidatus Bathyarchaeia archaeon]